MQQRYYDPVAGRFLSVDPIATDANTGKGFSQYAYVDNNPYSRVDPDGRQARPIEINCPVGTCSTINYEGPSETVSKVGSPGSPGLGGQAFWGTVKLGAGGLGAVTGAGLCTSFVGCALGLPMAAMGGSQAIEGATMLGGAYQGVKMNGINVLRDMAQRSSQYGAAAYDLFNLGVNLGSLGLKVELAVPVQTIDRTKSMFGAMVSRFDNGKNIPGFGYLSKNYTQALAFITNGWGATGPARDLSQDSGR